MILKVRSAIAYRTDTAMALVTPGIVQGTLLLSGVLIARLLGPEDRGVLQSFALVPLILIQLGAIGLPLAVTFYVSRDPDSVYGIIQLLKKPFLLLTILLVTLQGLILLVAFSGSSETVKVAVLVSLAATPGGLAQAFGAAVLQGLQRFVAFNLLRIMHLILYSGALLILFALKGDSLLLASVVWSGSFLLAGMITLTYVSRLTRYRQGAPVTGTTFRELLEFGRRSFIGSLNPIDSLRLDQLLVVLFFGPTSLGFYVVALAFTNIPRFIAQSLGGVAYPKVAHSPSTGARVTSKFVGLTLVMCGLSVLAVESTVGWLVPTFFGEAFGPAINLSRVLLLSALFFSLRRVLTDCARGMGRPDLGTLAEISSWLVMIPALAILAPAHGLIGIAWSLAAASIISFTFLSITTWRLFHGSPTAAVRISQEFAR